MIFFVEEEAGKKIKNRKSNLVVLDRRALVGARTIENKIASASGWGMDEPLRLADADFHSFNPFKSFSYKLYLEY
jgi:hypothetical protein